MVTHINTSSGTLIKCLVPTIKPLNATIANIYLSNVSLMCFVGAVYLILGKLCYSMCSMTNCSMPLIAVIFSAKLFGIFHKASCLKYNYEIHHTFSYSCNFLQWPMTDIRMEKNIKM